MRRRLFTLAFLASVILCGCGKAEPEMVFSSRVIAEPLIHTDEEDPLLNRETQEEPIEKAPETLAPMNLFEDPSFNPATYWTSNKTAFNVVDRMLTYEYTSTKNNMILRVYTASTGDRFYDICFNGNKHGYVCIIPSGLYLRLEDDEKWQHLSLNYADAIELWGVSPFANNITVISSSMQYLKTSDMLDIFAAHITVNEEVTEATLSFDRAARELVQIECDGFTCTISTEVPSVSTSDIDVAVITSIDSEMQVMWDFQKALLAEE